MPKGRPTSKVHDLESGAGAKGAPGGGWDDVMSKNKDSGDIFEDFGFGLAEGDGGKDLSEGGHGKLLAPSILNPGAA